MCVLIIKPQNTPLPARHTLLSAWNQNKDGAGYARPTRDGKAVRIEKGFFDFADFYHTLCADVRYEDHAIIHFRLATSGQICNDHCHPFGFGKGMEDVAPPNLNSFISSAAIAHNGVFASRDWGWSIDQEDHASDTMLWAKRFLPPTPDLLNDSYVALLDASVRQSHNKVAILTPFSVIPLGHFTKHTDGSLYSQTSFMTKPKRAKKYTYTQGRASDFKPWDNLTPICKCGANLTRASNKATGAWCSRCMTWIYNHTLKSVAGNGYQSKMKHKNGALSLPKPKDDPEGLGVPVPVCNACRLDTVHVNHQGDTYCNNCDEWRIAACPDCNNPASRIIAGYGWCDYCDDFTFQTA